jgi:membrane protein YqaA with SNARE-associated domain
MPEPVETQTAQPQVIPPAMPKVPRWHYHRRMYDWMLGFAHTRHATATLFTFAFVEAVFFPVPPFVLQVPMTLERRERAWRYALISTIGSVVGGMLGYLIGLLFHGFALRLFGEEKLHLLEKYTSNTVLLTGGVIAIHPYKLFTIAAGFLKVPLASFVVASIVGRGILFFAIAALLYLFGPPVRVFIDKYFNILTIAFGLLIIAAIFFLVR